MTIGSGVTVKAPNDGILRLGHTGEKFEDFNINAPLLEANAHALVAGLPGSDGAINLTAANTFAGGTTLQGGGLFLGHNSALGTGAVTVLASTGDKMVLGASVSSVTLSNAIAVSDNLTIGTGKYDDSNNFTPGTTTLVLNGVISDLDAGHHGRLYPAGPTVLNGANTCSGGTYVEANTTVNHDAGLGKGFVDVGYNAILTFTTAHPTIGFLADAGQFIGGGGTGTIELSPGVLDLNINPSGGGSGNFSGQITGTAGASAAALIKNGTAQLSLLGDNAGQFTGGTRINAGSLVIGDSNATTATFGATWCSPAARSTSRAAAAPSRATPM